MTITETGSAPGAPAIGESRPTSTTVFATWRGDRRYEIGRPGGPAVTIDAAGQEGLGPVDTLLGALAACSAIDVVEYLAKRRTPATRVDVRVDAERRPTSPRRVLWARLEFAIDGEGIDLTHRRARDYAVVPDVLLDLAHAGAGCPARVATRLERGVAACRRAAR
jgi:putative redox protein